MAENPPNPAAPATEGAEAPETEGGHAAESLKKILRDFVNGTKDLLRFVFIEQRAERRKELIESLRFYVTYK